MTTRDARRASAIGKLSAHLIASGLSQTSLRQLAAAAEVSDRMLLYYFADKAEVLAATLQQVAADMAGQLAVALPETPLPPQDLALRLARLTAQPELRRYMRLWIEILAAAARGEEPFAALASQIVEGFVTWVETRLDAPPGPERRALATAILAVIDGLAVIDICSPATGREELEQALGGLLGKG